MTEVEVRPAAPVPTFLGQGTAIEQSRAVAEVHAMVLVAQQCPRNITAAISTMRQSCKQKGLAERAFYKYPRGGTSVQGPSVHLARELARCFGNVTYGITELRRDDVNGLSEMQAFAWDLETNTRSTQIFVVPHKRDKKGGVEVLTDLRDVYETTANMGARRLRAAIYSILPPWFVEEAQDLCAATLRDGGDRTIPQRVADAVKSYSEIGVTADQLEQKLGRKSGLWNEYDLAQLVVTFKSLQRGEIRREEEFPQTRVTAAEVVGQAAGTPPVVKSKKAPATPPSVPPRADDGDRSDEVQTAFGEG